MSNTPDRKQVSAFFTVKEFLRLRKAAADKGISMGQYIKDAALMQLNKDRPDEEE